MFTIPAIRLADAQVQHNPDLWMYRFDWRTPVRGGAFGAHHFLEVPFAFDQIDNPQAAGFLGTPGPQELAAATHSAWVSFVKDGNPNNAALPDVAALRRRHPADDAVRRAVPGRDRSPTPTRSSSGTACSRSSASRWSCTRLLRADTHFRKRCPDRRTHEERTSVPGRRR